jgi:hypothetical protein
MELSQLFPVLGIYLQFRAVQLNCSFFLLILSILTQKELLIPEIRKLMSLLRDLFIEKYPGLALGTIIKKGWEVKYES